VSITEAGVDRPLVGGGDQDGPAAITLTFHEGTDTVTIRATCNGMSMVFLMEADHLVSVDQQVAVSEQRDQQAVDQALLADDAGPQLVAQRDEGGGCRGRFWHVHGLFWGKSDDRTERRQLGQRGARLVSRSITDPIVDHGLGMRRVHHGPGGAQCWPSTSSSESGLPTSQPCA
jgi:hypothetical protein